jgi:hypothetical protein
VAVVDEAKTVVDEAWLVEIGSKLLFPTNFLVETSNQSSRRRFAERPHEVEIVVGGSPSVLVKSK